MVLGSENRKSYALRNPYTISATAGNPYIIIEPKAKCVAERKSPAERTRRSILLVATLFLGSRRP
jgi:hypothetical protein